MLSQHAACMKFNLPPPLQSPALLAVDCMKNKWDVTSEARYNCTSATECLRQSYILLAFAISGLRR
jgi:hypothetical protein